MSDKRSAAAEARRQIEICNACRYCEGFCSVFPAITRQTLFADGDILQLANLCHDCRACYYACQYTHPHEFRLNLPQALSEVRVTSWQRFIRPGRVARLFQEQGLALAAMLVLGLAVLLIMIQALRPDSGQGFYAYLSHTAMVALFTPAFLLPLLIIGQGLSRYWLEVSGKPVRFEHIGAALSYTGHLKNLAGGQGQGCNYEAGDRFSNQRRWLHQAVLWGFLLCFASTTSGTVLHYLFARPAPYGLFSLPKLLGLPGGILLVIGCTGLAWLKIRAERQPGAARVWGGEMAFVLLLAATGVTGIMLYLAADTAAVPILLALHLGTVLAFFLLMPYSKMVHGFFRFAALLRDAQQR